MLSAKSAEEESVIADKILRYFRSGNIPPTLMHLQDAGIRDILDEFCKEDVDLELPSCSIELHIRRARDGSIIVFSRRTREGSQLNITHNQLKRARDVLGVKLSEVKDRLNISKTTVWKWEKGVLHESPARKITEYIDNLELQGVTFMPDGGISWSPRLNTYAHSES